MTTGLTSIEGVADLLAVAELLPQRHLHLRGDWTTARSPYFVDAWTNTADSSAGDHDRLVEFLDYGGRLELCEATAHPRDWCRAKLFGRLMVPEFAARELEPPITEATFDRCLRAGVWLAIAWSGDEPVAVAVLQPCTLEGGELAARGSTSRDRFILAAQDDDLRSLLLAALPDMVAAQGVEWLRARRRPWMVTEELDAWACELDLASELVCGFRTPGDALLFRPELLRSGEGIVYAVGPEVEFKAVGRSASTGGVVERCKALDSAGRIRALAS